MSGFQLIISLITFSLAIRLMCMDPHWSGGRMTKVMSSEHNSQRNHGGTEMRASLSESMQVFLSRQEKYKARLSQVVAEKKLKGKKG